MSRKSCIKFFVKSKVTTVGDKSQTTYICLKGVNELLPDIPNSDET